MKYVFLSNFISHHQIPFSKAMLKDSEYHFIATDKMPDERKRLGYREYSAEALPYLFEIDGDERKYREAIELATTADVAIIGSAPYDLVAPRIKQGKLTIYYSERIFKNPVLLAKMILKGRLIQHYVLPGRKRNVCLLCASAYLPGDLRPFGAFRGRAYRWGYFPHTQCDPLLQIMSEKQHDIPQILWVGRLIPWKRPHFALHLARALKELGYQFKLTIIGTGELGSSMREKIDAMHLNEHVHLAGAMPPENVRKAMNQSDIFVFTSNRQEGWGAVLNEAMNSACGVVCCREIGSAPYLIREDQNGLLFDHADQEMLVSRVRELLDDPQKCRQLGEQAYTTITSEWNAEEAARRLKIMCRSILENGDCNEFSDGPCSKAPVIR